MSRTISLDESNWPTRSEEFKNARALLVLMNGSPAGPGTTINDLDKTYHISSTGKEVSFTRRFLMGQNGELYAKSTTHVFKQGCFGNVKLAETEDGSQYVIKEIDKSRHSLAVLHSMEQEGKTAVALKKARDAFHDNSRSIIIYYYLGIPLNKYLKEISAVPASKKTSEVTRAPDAPEDAAFVVTTDSQPAEPISLDQDARMKIFELLLAELTRLHQAGYAHLDIKPDNITVEFDPSGNIKALNLIDFGFSEDLAGKMTHYKGTPNYFFPYYNGASKYMMDVFAAMRVNFLPNHYLVLTETNGPRRVCRKSSKPADTIIPLGDNNYYDAMYGKDPYFSAVNLATCRLNPDCYSFPTAAELYAAQVLLRFGIQMPYLKNIPWFLEEYEKLAEKDKNPAAINELLKKAEENSDSNGGCVRLAANNAHWLSVCEMAMDSRLFLERTEDFCYAGVTAKAGGEVLVSSFLQEQFAGFQMLQQNSDLLLQWAQNSEFDKCLDIVQNNHCQLKKIPTGQEFEGCTALHFFALACRFELLVAAYKRIDPTLIAEQIADKILYLYVDIMIRKLNRQMLAVKKKVVFFAINNQLAGLIEYMDKQNLAYISLVRGITPQFIKNALDHCLLTLVKHENTKTVHNLSSEKQLAYEAAVEDSLERKKQVLLDGARTQLILSSPFFVRWMLQFYCLEKQKECAYDLAVASLEKNRFYKKAEHNKHSFYNTLHRCCLLGEFVRTQPAVDPACIIFLNNCLILHVEHENEDHIVNRHYTYIDMSWIKGVIRFADEARQAGRVDLVQVALALLCTYFGYIGAKKPEDINIPDSGDEPVRHQLNTFKKTLQDLLEKKRDTTLVAVKPPGESNGFVRQRFR